MFNDKNGNRTVWLAFAVPFLIVFLGVFLTATIVTFILPETYAGTARIKLNPGANPLPSTNQAINAGIAGWEEMRAIQSEVAVMHSELVLDPVVERLNLNDSWSKKYSSPQRFKTPETRALLRRMLEIRPVINSRIITVTVFSDERLEAATIANAVAEQYLRYLAELRLSPAPFAAQIIDHAEPADKPVKPNKPLNLLLGFVMGGVMGAIAGGLGAGFADRINRGKRRKPPAIPQI